MSEGIVFAADSRQVYRNEKKNWRIASDNAQKIFPILGKIGGLTYGQASICDKSILSLVEEYRSTTRPASGRSTVKEIAEDLSKFLDAKWKECQQVQQGKDSPSVGLIVAGYEPGGNRRVFECLVPGPSVIELASPDNPGVTWQGQTDVVTRLIRGFDPRINKLSWFQPQFTPELAKLNYALMLNVMAMQDAIDFCVFLIRTTIDMQRFSDGIDLDPGDIAGTGGPIDVAVVRPSEGFTWIQRKDLKVDSRQEARRDSPSRLPSRPAGDND